MRIYTKTGDKGETGLVGGKRVSKSSVRVDAYGDVDELNAALGAAASFLDASDSDVLQVIAEIQEQLFVLGSALATPPDYKGRLPARQVKPENVEALEKLIDAYDEKLPGLKRFIFPYGTKGACLLHLARAVCRRAERSVVRLSEIEPIDPEMIRYLNRLSDFVFVLARTMNARQNVEEVEWEPWKR